MKLPFLTRLFAHREAPAGRPALAGLAVRLARPSALRPPGSTALLENLAPERLAQWLAAYERGALRQACWLADQAARRDATLHAVLARRAAALLDMDWDVRTVEDSPAAAAQAATLRAAYERLTNLREILRHLATAALHGVAAVEIVLLPAGDSPTGSRLHLEPLPAWALSRDGHGGPWQLAPDGGAATPLPPERVLLRECPAPLLYVALPAYLRKQLGIVDWCAFVETYGVPATFVVMPPGIPAEEETKYIEAAEAALGTNKGVLPNGTTIQSVTSQGASGETFEKFLAYLDAQIVLAGTGGKLAVLNEATGLGGGAAGEHADAFEQLARAEAAEISEVFQRQFDKPLLAAAHPGQPVLAYFELAAEEVENTTAIATQAATLATAGYEIDPQQLSERTGYKLRLKPAAPAPATFPLANRDFSFAEDLPRPLGASGPTAEIRRALAADLRPLRPVLLPFLRQVEAGTATPAALAAVLAELERLAPEVLAGGALTTRLHAALATATTQALATS